MKAFYYLLIACFIGSAKLFAQVCLNPTGADCWGIGAQSVTQLSVFGVLNNPATIVYIDQLKLGITQEVKYKQSALSLSSLVVVKPGKRAHVGFGLVQQGNAAFNQQRIVLSMAKALSSMVSMGINSTFLGTHIEEQNYKGNFITEFGLFIKPNSKFDLACFLFNPTQQKYKLVISEPIPSFVRFGFTYKFSSQLNIKGELEHRVGFTNIPRIGFEYMPVPLFTLYAGWANNPAYFSFGTAFQFDKLRLSIAASQHQVLGFTPHFSCVFQLSKNRK